MIYNYTIQRISFSIRKRVFVMCKGDFFSEIKAGTVLNRFLSDIGVTLNHRSQMPRLL